jgi:hypothetical protein
MKSLAFGMSAALLSVSAFAATSSTCVNIDSTNDYFAQVTNGQLSLRGSVCEGIDGSMDATGTMSFNHFTPPSAPGFSANGAVTFAFDQSAQTGAASMSYDGPIDYAYQGQTYHVVFNHLTLNLANSANGLAPTSATGSVSINGATMPAGTWAWNFLF